MKASVARGVLFAAAVASVAGCVNQPGFGYGGRQPAAAAAWPVADTPMTRADYIEIQSRLAQLGYRPGPADGLPGARTRRAISAYQRDVGVAPDGRLTDTLMASLREDTSARLTGVGREATPVAAHASGRATARATGRDSGRDSGRASERAPVPPQSAGGVVMNSAQLRAAFDDRGQYDSGSSHDGGSGGGGSSGGGSDGGGGSGGSGGGGGGGGGGGWGG